MGTVKKYKKPKPMTEAEKQEFHKNLAAVLKRLKKPKNKQEAYNNWLELTKVTKGTGWMAPDFDEPMELV